MKYSKVVTLAATILVVGGALAACSPDKGTSESSSASSSEVTNASSSTTEAVTGASISDKADVIEKALSADGSWIVAATADITFDKELAVAGEFHNRGEASEDIYRKLALYAQDDKRVVTDEYTLTAPKVIVESENFNIVHGTVKGDIEVKANGFVLDAAKVEGNIVFEKEEYKTSAVIDKDGASVTGEVTVAE